MFGVLSQKNYCICWQCSPFSIKFSSDFKLNFVPVQKQHNECQLRDFLTFFLGEGCGHYWKRTLFADTNLLSSLPSRNLTNCTLGRGTFKLYKRTVPKYYYLWPYLLCFQGNSAGEGGLDEGLVSLTMNGKWCVMYEVRGAWYVVRGARHKAWDTRYMVHGTWHT